MIKALLFDMDGLIFDTEGLYKIAWQKAATEQGIDLSDELYQNFVGVQDPACEQLLLSWFGDRFDLARYQRVRDQYLRELKQEQPDYKVGFKQLFREVKHRQLKVALVTSSYLKDVKHHFSGSGFLEQFDAVITAERVENGKPAPDCYQMACAELGVEAQYCLVVEDSNNGMLAGLDAGCQGVMIPDLLPASNEIKTRANYILDSLQDVISVL